MSEEISKHHRFFEHTECEYYPCHAGIEHINCLFCYCPMYHLENCPGNPEWREKDGRRVKSCVNCTFPHRAENYDAVMQILKSTAQENASDCVSRQTGV